MSSDRLPSNHPVPSGLVIAVDGPAASGKGTIARALARHFGLPHLDTGLLYRAVGLNPLRRAGHTDSESVAPPPRRPGLPVRRVGLNLLRWGGDPESEFAALRACDFSQVDFADPDLKSEG